MCWIMPHAVPKCHTLARMTKQIRSQIVMFRLTAEQEAVIKDLAESDFLTVSEIIRIALAEYLARRGNDIRAYRGATRGPWARKSA